MGSGQAQEIGSTVWLFANAELNETERQLRVDGQPVALDAAAFAVLRCLLEAEGELVTPSELIAEVWPEDAAPDEALAQAIKAIHTALKDPDKRVLREVGEHGFRLDVPIDADLPDDQAAPAWDLEPESAVPGLPGWVFDTRMQTRPSNELWKIRRQADGEFGVLKLARDARAERALKREVTLNRVLQAEFGDDPPLVPTVQWQFSERPFWIRMPWYTQGSLSEWFASRGASNVTLQQRVDLMAETAEALARAHAIGVMHKDIKPGNLLIDESGKNARIRLCDFGCGTAHSRARLAQAGVTVMGFTRTITSHTGGDASPATVSGTPTYMAPELLTGGVFSERSDVYSMGVMLYQFISSQMHAPLAPGWEDDIADEGLRQIIASACAGRPEKRTPGMHELARQLRGWSPGAGASRPQHSGQHNGIRLSAIMFTDMVGYSALVRADEGAARELLDLHIAMMREALAKHSGQEIEIVGDAFLIGFPSAVLATRCAVEYQRRQAAYNDSADEARQFRVRIGIHIGDVEWRDGRVFGHGVNFAARIEPHSPPGGIAVSPNVKEAVASRLNLPFRSLGQKTLKNVADNVELFGLSEAAIRGEQETAPRAAGAFLRSRRSALVVATLVVASIALGWVLLQPVQQATPPDPTRAAYGGGAPPPGVAAEEASRISLLPFDLLGLDAQAARVMAGLQDALASDLARERRWRLVMTRNLDAMGLANPSTQAIGQALKVGRLIRGSIQQAGDMLRVNVQVVNAASGETLWAESIRGTTKDLFGLQERIGVALVIGLGGQPEPAGYTPSNNEAYSAYLEARSIFRQPNGAHDERSDEDWDRVFDGIDAMLAAHPDFIDGHSLALSATMVAYHWSVMSRPQALARVDRHLGTLRRLNAPAYDLAVAQAGVLAVIERDLPAALDKLAPFRDQAMRNRDHASSIGTWLARAGRVDEALDYWREYIDLEPADSRTAMDYVVNAHLMGRMSEALAAARSFAQRFHTRVGRQWEPFIRYSLTGDTAYLDRWLALGEVDEIQTIVPYLQQAWVKYDRAAIRAFIDPIPNDAPDYARTSSNGALPGVLRKARVLLALDEEPETVRLLARNALVVLDKRRQESDSPFSQIFASEALALLGRADEALRLHDQALRGTPASRDALDASILAVEGAKTLAATGQIDRLVQTIEQEAAGLFPGFACMYLGLSVETASLRRMAEAQAALDRACTPFWQRNREALE